MLKKIDSSRFLVRLLERMSTLLARSRGVPVVFGVAFIIAGFVLELLNVAIGSTSLEMAHIILRNGGVLVALIGLLLSEPLGQ